MTITIDGIEFDEDGYDARGDVLYLKIAIDSAGGLPRHGYGTDERHRIEFDEIWQAIAMTLVNA